MTNKEILEKAIQKAIEGGWRPQWVGEFKSLYIDPITGEYFATWQYKDLKPFGYSVIGILYFHDFAKALWGERELRPMNLDEIKEIRENYTGASGGYAAAVEKEGWQYHLQQMVIAPDPIKYLGENI